MRSLIVALIATLIGCLSAPAHAQGYAVTPANCGVPIVARGGFYTVTLPATTGFAMYCEIIVVDGDSASGKALAGFPPGLTSPNMLYPNQALIVENVGGAWYTVLNPGRWKAPLGTVLYLDANGGNDSNDCLSTSTACQTPHEIFGALLKDWMDLTGDSTFSAANPNGLANVFVQLADNASNGIVNGNCYGNVHIAFLPVGAQGRAAVVLQGDHASPGNTVVCGEGTDVGVYGPSTIEIRDLEIGRPGEAGEGGIQAADGAHVRLEAGIILAGSNPLLASVSNGSQISLDGPIWAYLGAPSLVQVADGGVIDFQGQAVTFAGTSGFTNTVDIEGWGYINLYGVTWSGGAAVSGGKFYCGGVGFISTGTGNGNSIPGSVAGVAQAGCQVY